jgi:hypothetical protein
VDVDVEELHHQLLRLGTDAAADDRGIGELVDDAVSPSAALLSSRVPLIVTSLSSSPFA